MSEVSVDRAETHQELLPLPTQRAIASDPPQDYAKFREAPGLQRVRTLKGEPAWLVTRYEDVRTVLSDRRFSSSPTSPGYPSYISGNVPPPPGFFMQWDDPEHSRLRVLVAREFITKQINEMRPSIQTVVDDELEKFFSLEQPADLVKHLAYPVAFRNICGLVGVPTSDQSFVQETVDAILDRRQTAAVAESAAISLMNYFDGVVSEKTNRPSDDLVGRLVDGALRTGKLTHSELVGVTALLLLGGYDTMVQVIGLGVLTLIDHPNRLNHFIETPSADEAFIDELVRYLSVNHAGLPRAALEDVEIGGQIVRKGEGILVMLNSGNRDDAAFDFPDLFDPSRDSRAHVGFGHGVHKCIGAPFARAELPVVFRSLFSKAPQLRLSVPRDTLQFRDEMVLYGVCSLPVSW